MMICPQVTQLLHQVFPVAFAYEAAILVLVTSFFSYMVFQEVVKILRQRRQLSDKRNLLDNTVGQQIEECTFA